VVFFQVGDDYFPDAFNKLVAGLLLVWGGIDGFIDDHGDTAGVYLQGAFGHDLGSPGDGDGYDGDTGVQGEMKHPLLERLDPAVSAPGALRETHDGLALPYLGRRFLDTLHGPRVVLSVDLDVAGILHGPAENRDVEQFLLGNPAELPRNEGEDDEDIDVALVVGHEYLGTIDKDVFRASYIDPHVGKDEKHLRPDPRHLVDGVLSGAQEGENNGAGGEEAGDDNR